MKNSDQLEKRIKTFFHTRKSAVKTTSALDEHILNHALEAHEQSKPKTLATSLPIVWRNIMRNRLIKVAAGCIATLGVAGLVYVLTPGMGNSGLAFAEVLVNIQNAKTLTYSMTVEGEEQRVHRTMVIDGHYWRHEFANGDIWIMDILERKALIMDAASRVAKSTMLDADKVPDMYDALRNIRDNPDYVAREIGQREIDGIQAVGYELTRETDSRQMTVWVSRESQLPIRIEQTIEDAHGSTIRTITSEIQFDVTLDESLFSLEPPEGYELQIVDYDPVNRLKSAVNVNRILKACRSYVEEHEGQWPDSLQELTAYGLEQKVFINPRQPERQNAYVYLKPTAPPSESTLVMYEAYDVWNYGINVGLENYQVQLIKEESEFKALLGE